MGLKHGVEKAINYRDFYFVTLLVCQCSDCLWILSWKGAPKYGWASELMLDHDEIERHGFQAMARALLCLGGAIVLILGFCTGWRRGAWGEGAGMDGY